MIPQINQKFFDEFYRKYRKIALVYLRSSKDKDANYDPFRETGYVQTNQNPLPVKVLTKVVSPESLTHRELGLTKAGALQIIIQDRDVELIKNSDKISIDNIDYYVYDEAVGNKFQIYPSQFAKFSKIILFRKDVG
jgi:hypothetical protein